MNANDKPSAEKSKPSPNVQGEGDYESARRFRNDTEHFLKNADVPELAREAAPKSKEEAAELKKAEEIGRSHAAKGKDLDAKTGGSAGPNGK
jgi:hypothetical protein